MVNVKLIEVTNASQRSKRVWYQVGDCFFVFDTEGDTGIPVYLLANIKDTDLTIRKKDAVVVKDVPVKILCFLLASFYTLLPIRKWQKWWRRPSLKVKGI